MAISDLDDNNINVLFVRSRKNTERIFVYVTVGVHIFSVPIGGLLHVLKRF